MSNKRIDQLTTIDPANALMIPVWDPTTNTTKNVLARDIAYLYNASGAVLVYATPSVSGNVYLATSGEVITGTNNTKAVTPLALSGLRYNKSNTSASYTLNQLSGEITDPAFGLGPGLVTQITISNNLMAAGDMVAVEIQTADLNTDKLVKTSVYCEANSIRIGIWNGAAGEYGGTLKIKFKKL